MFQIKKFVSVHVGVLALVVGASILLGLVGSLYQVGNRSWVPAAIDKAQIVLGMRKVQGVAGGMTVSTSRYEFVTAAKAEQNGVYQLADIDGNTLLAVERNTGRLIAMTPSETGYTEREVAATIFPKEVDEWVKKNPPPPGNTKAPIIMDLHFGLKKLLYTLVVQEKEKDQVCQSLVMYEVPFTNVAASVGAPVERFRTPCVRDRHNAVMWAGRIATNDRSIFLTVGEQRYDRSGNPKKDIISAADLPVAKTVFGKTLEFNPKNFTFVIFSSGHRNAQGLFWDADHRQLYSAEHGASGGDEVNLLERGKNYGWPMVSYGKPYPNEYPSGKPIFNEGKNPGVGVDMLPERVGLGLRSGTHDGYAQPLLSWSPGVGVGNLLRVPAASPLKDWRGELLVATMGEQHLHRLHLIGSAVVMDENIPIGKRIRDLVLLKNGDLAFGLDEGTLVILKVEQMPLPPARAAQKS